MRLIRNAGFLVRIKGLKSGLRYLTKATIINLKRESHAQ